MMTYFSQFDSTLFWHFFLPRTLAAFSVGGGLCVASILVQTSFRYAFSDAFSLGIAAAAAFGALLGSILHFSPVPMSSSLSLLCSILHLTLLTFLSIRKNRAPFEVLFIGIVLSFFYSGLSSIIIALADPTRWSTVMVWLLGTVTGVTLNQSLFLTIAVFFCFLLSLVLSKPLELLGIDENSARTLGVRPELIRTLVLVLASTVTACCVALTGMVGFIGLIVPNIFRLFFKIHRVQSLLLISFIFGGFFLIACDLAVQVLFSPLELPIGVMVNCLGILPLLYLFWVSRK